ncbi:MAG: outer membrane lipid asymmetry maintenance protein MlaD [Deltaproteobacteria bacterium]|nr:outer membrane lipid asymmetry maintenance protein MlaD [Deltaproteobacteria bacterium]
MKKGSVETMVGLFVLAGIICVSYLAIKLGKMELIGDNYYSLQARFESVSGLNAGAEVELAGVKIGKVESIALDTDLKVAIANMRIRKGVELTDDVIASIKTSGLIGDKYINLSPGGSDEILKPGDSIVETESAIDIEALISKYVFGKVD